MSQKLTCFKAYDIRGKLGEELNDDISYRIGRATAHYLEPKKIVLGGDIRNSSSSLKASLAKGLIESGVDVIDLGMTGTEEVYFATTFLQADGGIEITASHNPIDYNGMKFVRANSAPISGDSGLNQIKILAELNEFQDDVKNINGSIKYINLKSEYVNKILSFIDLSTLNKPLKIVINSGNGSAGPVIDIIEDVFSINKIPVTFIKVHNNPDGDFPNGIPNPLLVDCRTDTSHAVIENGADLGIAFDGDFDRCFFFDHQGDFIEGYYIVGLLASAFADKHPGCKIIHDPRLTWNTIELLNSKGAAAVQSKTGHAYIKEIMRAEDAIYGGEMSAHHYFKDFYYCDSGMIPWLLVLEYLSKSGKTLRELVSSYQQNFPASGEININIEDPKLIISNVLSQYKDSAISISNVDGLSMEFKNWRFNLRMSNTEPLVRLNVESRGDINLMDEKTKELLSLIQQGE